MDKIAIVTGAGSGIGRAVSLALLANGYAVGLAGRNSNYLEETARLAKADSQRAVPIPADVADPGSVETLFNRVQAVFGRLDLLFNNAGVAAGGPIEDLPFEKWQMVMNVNVTGTFLCTQQAVRMMKSQSPRGGRIINNGSISAHAPRPNAAPYTASKHAVTGLTRSTSLDGRKYDIACGQIDIGNASTQIGQSNGPKSLQADGTERAEPMMDVSLVAQSVLYMASLPLEANVQFLTVMATKMPFVGRG